MLRQCKFGRLGADNPQHTVVFVLVSDPVTQGFVSNLAHPGGNITGFSAFEPSTAGKWLDLLKQASPGIVRVAVIFNPDTSPQSALEGAHDRVVERLRVNIVSMPEQENAKRLRLWTWRSLVGRGLLPIIAPRRHTRNVHAARDEDEQPMFDRGAVRHDAKAANSEFLTLEHIFLDRDLPYQTQLVPLAAILAELGDSWEEIGIKQKVRQWYWCGVLGELYGGAVESRHARDLPECLSWIQDGGPLPTTVSVTPSFNPDRLLTLRTRNSAAYKGIYALLMQRGGREFLTDVPISFQTYEEERIDIHHIFPKAWCKKYEIEHKRMDCVVNKTALSARTNRIIGGAAPSTYLRALEKRGNVASPPRWTQFYQHTSSRQKRCAQTILKCFLKRGAKLF